MDKDFPYLYDNGIYFLAEDVNEESCADVMKFIIERNFDKENIIDNLTLIINSPGGKIPDGFALIDVMAGSKLPIHTIGLGIVASMGLMLFISGEKGKRILTPNTLIMSHQWSSYFCGKEHELLAAKKEQTILSEMVLRHYKKHTGLPIKKIKEILLPASDVWLTATEAKKLGLCDLIKDI